MRLEVYERDAFMCGYCGKRKDASELTIDHVIPLALGGLDEITNYVTCCRSCNQVKAAKPFREFADSIGIDTATVPVHGDPVLDNPDLPSSMRAVRRKLHDAMRDGLLQFGGKQAYKKFEKTFRTEFWATDEGRALEARLPELPGHVRIMVPEIQAIAKSRREYLLLVELAKSANTRDLIGTVLTREADVERRLSEYVQRGPDDSTRRRIAQALRRFERAVRKESGEETSG